MNRFHMTVLLVVSLVIIPHAASAQGNLLNTSGVAEVHSMSCQAIDTAINQIDHQGNRVARFGRLAKAVRNISGDPYQVSDTERAIGSAYGRMYTERQRLYVMAAEARCGAGLSFQELLAYADIDSGMSCSDIFARQQKIADYQSDIRELDVALQDLGMTNVGTSSANQQLADLQSNVDNAARRSGCSGASTVPPGGIVGKIGN